jgi:hypothetical protein
MDSLHALTTTEEAASEAAYKPCHLFWYERDTSVLRAYLLMEQSSSWEANRFAASQEIPRILLNPKVD